MPYDRHVGRAPAEVGAVVLDVAKWGHDGDGEFARMARLENPSVCLHVIRHAVAMARLIGVLPPVHVRQVERANGAHHAAAREEFADRDRAAHIDAENVRTTREEIAEVLWRRDALREKGFVDPARRG